MTDQTPSITFKQFSDANKLRSLTAFGHDVTDQAAPGAWTNDQWMTAITGELGEAASALKAINRRQLAKDMHVTPRDVAVELADMVTYADLLCTQLGFDLGQIVAEKFNEVSVRVSSDVRLPEASDHD